MMHQGAGAGCGRVIELAEVAHRLFRVPAEEFGGIGHLGTRIRQRLAILQRHQLGDALGVAHDQLEGLAQNFAALARLLRRPGGKGFARGVDRSLGIVNRGAGNRGDDVFGRRIDHVEALAVRRFAPGAADPEVGRHTREKIVIHGFFLTFFRSFR